MVRGKGGMDRSLTQGEIQDIKGQKSESEATLRYLEQNPGASRQDSVDKARLQREIQHYDGVLQQGTPKTPRGVNKDAMVKEAQELEVRIKTGIPTRAEMDHPAKHPGAIHKHLNWSKRTDTDVRRYKEIQRRLHPEDPTATDVERFRAEGK